MLKGKLHMSIITKRLVSIAASTLVLSVISASANAQIDVLTGIADYVTEARELTSVYTFNRSMILNSVGFVDPFNQAVSMSFSIDGIVQSVSYSNLLQSDPFTLADGGIRWLTLSNPITIQENSVVRISTLGPSSTTFMKQFTRVGSDEFASTNPSANVTYSGANSGWKNYSNSNLRVSNPGSNVAPEPGSFALALTGGAALIGICVRRRRNAG